MWLDSGIYQEVEDLTGTYYTKDFLENKDDQVFIPEEKIQSLVENLLIVIKKKDEKYKKLEKDLEENFKPVDKAELYDISENWFH